MRLHIFNPEHDIALAANQKKFTAPHAGRQMRADLGFLPALWAEDGDMVLVDDVEAALEALRHLRRYAADVVFVTLSDLRNIIYSLKDNLVVSPWGWDITLKEQLERAVDDSSRLSLPDDNILAAIRQMSSRQFAAEQLLPKLSAMEGATIGESRWCSSLDEVLIELSRLGGGVVKSPWSSSGRGVRYIRCSTPDAHLLGWISNVVRQQGGVMVEPFYQKVCDFGVEFNAGTGGRIEYCGLSLFGTRGGAYTGSLCATESDKRDILSRYVNLDLLDNVCSCIIEILQPLMNGVYEGPFGVDMMAVVGLDDGFMLHPCVELNLRRTMGHVALALSPSELEPRRMMSVYYSDKYRIRVQTLTDNLLNTGLV